MDAWIALILAELDIDIDPPISAILDVARDAAHGVARPAAPVTTFLMGVAVAKGADPTDVAQRIQALASAWGSGTQST